MDTINSIIIALLTAAVVYIVVRIVINYREFAAAYRQEVSSEIRRRISVISEEEHNGIYYWFDKDTDQFIAQGADAAEIIAHIKTQFKHEHLFILPGLEKGLVTPDCQIVDISQLTIKQL